jgi:hypothetical protein
MKPQFQLASLALLCSFLLHPSTSLAQGSLTPPGAPAPTMKSLSQVEARTLIATAPFTISQPGSYYLTSNLTVPAGNAIDITTSGVTLDLNGFTIRSTAASATGYGILINSSLRNITIVNGFIEGGVTNVAGVYSGSGFGYGIYYSGGAPVNVLVSRVSVAGCLDHGIFVGSNNTTVVESCIVRTVGGTGISALTIKQSTATDCGNDAIYGRQIADCRGESSGSGDGVSAITAQNCYGRSSSSGTGVDAMNAQNCQGASSSGFGVHATTAHNCYGGSSSGYGVWADVALGCYGYSSSGTGMGAQTAAFCIGYCPGGTAIEATIANGCRAAAGTTSITYKYDMP